MEFVKRYLKSRWTVLAICILCQEILYVALFLEGVSGDKLWYPMILSGAIVIAYFVFQSLPKIKATASIPLTAFYTYLSKCLIVPAFFNTIYPIILCAYHCTCNHFISSF